MTLAVRQPLSNRTAVVTGGTRGIGAAIARRLMADGATVLVTGASGRDRGPEGASFIAVDFCDRSALEAFAGELTARKVDILVNNAGINRVAPFADIKIDDFDQIHEVNLRAAFVLARAVIGGMQQRGDGRIVNITSIWGVIGKEYRGSYSASKFGMDGLTAALSAETAASGVLVNSVAPGFIDTELTRSVLGDKGIAELVARVPIKRLGRPEEVASLVAWLVGPENTYLTGQSVVIDGGFSRV